MTDIPRSIPIDIDAALIDAARFFRASGLDGIASGLADAYAERSARASREDCDEEREIAIAIVALHKIELGTSHEAQLRIAKATISRLTRKQDGKSVVRRLEMSRDTLAIVASIPSSNVGIEAIATNALRLMPIARRLFGGAAI